MKRTLLKRKTALRAKIGLKARRPARKKTEYQKLHDKAWTIFSRWIRRRDGKCFTCPATENLQAGHFHHNYLDFDEQNINAQCPRCNKWLHGNGAIYATNLVSKYGPAVLDDLIRRKPKLYSAEELRQIIAHYDT